MRVYLDNSATTQVYPEAAEAALRMMRECYGNPSSLHGAGFEAEKALKDARKTVASLAFGCREPEVIFTASGTEGDNTAIFGAWQSHRKEGNEIVTTAVEHPAVLEAMRRLEEEGAKVTYVGVGKDGKVDPAEVAAAVTPKTILISVMTVNNETGAVMPVREIAAHKGGALLHTDAVQALGKTDLTGLGADLITVSGHKIHAPKGVGALYVKKGVRIRPFLYGGGQEGGFRSGTENTPGIAAFAAAVRKGSEERDVIQANMKACRERLLAGILDQVPDVRVNSPADGSPSVLNVSFLGTRGEVILHRLEQEGIMVSTGSACSAGKKGGSHVLKAMGLTTEEVTGAIRFSFGAFNTPEEMDYVVEKIAEAVGSFRRLGSYR